MAVVLTGIVLEQAKTLYLQGQNPVQIGQQLGIKPDTIAKRASRSDWNIQRAAVQSSVNQVVSKAVISSLAKQGNKLRTALATELDQQAECLAREPVAAYSELANSKDGQGRAAVVKTIVEAATKVYGWDDPATSGLLGAGLRDLDSIDVEEVSNPAQLTDSQPDKPV